MESINPSVEDIISICNSDKNRFKSYLNSNHNNMMSSLFSDETDEKSKIKTDFLLKNINKSSKEIILLLKEKKQENKYFNYYKNLILLLASHNLDEENFQIELGKINEKTSERKNKGVYYTPEDISDFIIYNSIYQLILNKFNIIFKPIHPKQVIKKILNFNKGQILKIIDVISNCSVFDPTCGTGAFLVQIVQIKLDLLNKINGNVSAKDVDNIINNLGGNDLDPFSTYISKTRIIFKCLHHCKTLNLKNVNSKLNINFTSKNFIKDSFPSESFDLIVGNPPYVEKTKTNYANLMKYGNTYADVIHKSIELLKSNGILGFIIPLSYTSTNRMKNLRDFVEKKSKYQFILNYNDRPDCLFVGVHQKLSILFVNKNLSSNSKLYTSDYNYWYKNERDNLFNKPSVVLNKFKLDECYLKIGSKIEEDVFKKISKFGDNLLNLENKSGNNKLFLNMRATYWIKSFIEKPNKLNEYKVLRFSENNLHLANCILNSSLYWWFWIKISDCWHITNKELKYFSVPQINSEQIQRIKSLSLKLNSALEKSKKRIDTKQTMYEYKHKSCKKLIDKIDDELAKLYSLSEKEVSFIKKYKENYRIGRLDK